MDLESSLKQVKQGQVQFKAETRIGVKHASFAQNSALPLSNRFLVTCLDASFLQACNDRLPSSSFTARQDYLCASTRQSPCCLHTNA